MNPSETEPTQNAMSSSVPETFPLTKDQLLFAESIYACLPMSIEIYDTNGILRSINEHALQMYGVTDKTTVVNIVNLFNNNCIFKTIPIHRSLITLTILGIPKVINRITNMT